MLPTESVSDNCGKCDKYDDCTDEDKNKCGCSDCVFFDCRSEDGDTCNEEEHIEDILNTLSEETGIDIKADEFYDCVMVVVDGLKEYCFVVPPGTENPVNIIYNAYNARGIGYRYLAFNHIYIRYEPLTSGKDIAGLLMRDTDLNYVYGLNEKGISEYFLAVGPA